jgi:proline iminopeptidase
VAAAEFQAAQHAPPYTIETCLTDLESVRAHYGIDRWIIGGHSWGADLALIYAL